MLALDNSKIRAFMECPKRFQFRYEWDLAPGLEPWFLTGRAWGEAQDIIWSSAHEKPITLVDRAVEVFETTATLELDALSDEGASDWRIRDRYRYHDALAEYIATYAEFIRETFDMTKTQFEVPFEIELGNPPACLLIGRMDKVVWNIAEESWWVVEHKTTGMHLGRTYLDKWHNDNQIKTYGYVGRKFWGNVFGGILVDCMSISAKGKIATQMIPITIPPLAGGEWEADTIAIANAIVNAKGSRFPRNSDACEKYGKMCPYFEACSIGVDPREAPSAWGLHIEHWDPRELQMRRTNYASSSAVSCGD